MLLYLSKSEETKMRIFHALDKPIEDLTVEAICRKAGVSRPTFYNHFESKYDIPAWMGEFMCVKTLDEIGRTLTWEEGLRAYFELGISELFYLINSKAKAEAYETIVKKRELHRCEAVEQTLRMHDIEITPLLRRVISCYVKIELHLSEERMEPGQSQNVDEILEIALAFIPPFLYKALETPLEAANSRLAEH